MGRENSFTPMVGDHEGMYLQWLDKAGSGFAYSGEILGPLTRLAEGENP